MLGAIDDIDGRALFHLGPAATRSLIRALLDRTTRHPHGGFLDLGFDEFHVRSFVGMDTAPRGVALGHLGDAGAFDLVVSVFVEGMGHVKPPFRV
jgi:hypothetical protein